MWVDDMNGDLYVKIKKRSEETMLRVKVSVVGKGEFYGFIAMWWILKLLDKCIEHTNKFCWSLSSNLSLTWST